MNIIILWPWQLRLVVTVTSVLYAYPAPSIYNPEIGPNRNQHSFLHSKKFYLYSIPLKKHFLFTSNVFCGAYRSISRKYNLGQKMLRKMHVVCLILEYFPLKPGSFKILPPSPKKQCWSVARTFLLPTKQHWLGWGGGRGHHGAKYAG